MSKSSVEIIEDIIKATSKQESAEIIREIIASLNLSEGYVHLNKLKGQINDFKAQLEDYQRQYQELASPRNFEDVHELRMSLTFLYREIMDNLAMEINKLKLFYEERKTVQRAQSSLNLKNDEHFKSSFKSVSESLLRDYIGYDKGYEQWTKDVAFSYGLWKEVDSLMISTKNFIDALSSEERYLTTVKVQDAR